MNESEIEQILARFKLKDSPAVARTRVLTAARAAWNETRISSRAGPPATLGVALRAGNGVVPCSRGGDAVVWAWRWPACYAAAAALLLLLNGIVISLDQRWTTELIAEKAPELDDTPTAIEQLYVELGRDPAVARRLRMLTARPEPRGDINEFLRQKNQLLQATELL